jgi:putative ABC transport system permease protein
MGRLRAALWSGAELVEDAIREIGAHPLRSLLTLSGIVFGAASLVSMTSLAVAMRDMAYRDLIAIGFPRSFALTDVGPRSDARRAIEVRHPGLRLDDLVALQSVPHVESVHGRNFGRSYLVVGPADRRDVRVEGVDAGYLELRQFEIADGRSLSALEIDGAARVAVVGEELARAFFAGANPIGRTISIEGVRFHVIGVVVPRRFEIAPIDFDFVARRVYIPYTYFTRYERGEGRVNQALVTVSDTARLGEALGTAVALLKQRHAGVEDFRIDNEAAEVLEDLAMADSILGGWTGVMYAIAGVTLVVGGIGLFSVLLISVRERVREIGIRKALGADDGEILRLFLVESLTLAFLGAFVGIGGGAALVAVTEAISRQFGKDFSIAIQLPGVLLAIVFALLVGLIFGWYPARRAAKLEPVEAMASA